MPVTNFFAAKLLDLLTARQQLISLGTDFDIWCALSTTTPTKVTGAWNFTEPVGNGYTRVRIGFYDARSIVNVFPDATGSSVANNKTIFFPRSLASWGLITNVGIWDAETGGNLLAYGQLTQGITPSTNNVPVIEVGDLTIDLV